MLPRLTSDNEKERLLTFEFHIARFIYMHGITTSVSFIEMDIIDIWGLEHSQAGLAVIRTTLVVFQTTLAIIRTILAIFRTVLAM